MSEHDDFFEQQMAKLKAEGDQAIEGLKIMARGTHAFYSELRTQGFGHEEAMMLTSVWLQGMCPS